MRLAVAPIAEEQAKPRGSLIRHCIDHALDGVGEGRGHGREGGAA